ncbi:MAG: hypothetical protein VW879_07210 [Opitutae bacterium]
MVHVLVPPSGKTETNKRYGGDDSPYLPSPLLELPTLLPQFIQAPGLAKQLEERSSYTDEHRDEHLTGLLATATNGIFDYEVAHISVESGVFPIINTYNNESRFAIGARTELLHNRFGIGPFILSLLADAPLWVLTPHDIDALVSFSIGSHDKEGNKVGGTGLYPSWVHDEDYELKVDGLPPVLTELLTECHNNRKSTDWFLGDEEEVGRWPIATCSWYGFEPYKSRKTHRFLLEKQYATGCPPSERMEVQPPGDQGQGTDPLWIALDDFCEHAQNYCYSSCMPIYHEATEPELTIQSFGPFAKLLKYLSHGTIN